jgi:hypothetical protein
MQFKKILTAAAAATILSVAGLSSAADAAPFHRTVRIERTVRVDGRVVEHKVVFNNLRARNIRYSGKPYFVRGHYVVRSFGPRGARFIEVNPRTGAVIGFIRL